MNQDLIQLTERMGEGLQAFVDGLSDAERNVTGTFEKWSAKDVIAHIAAWMSNRAGQLAAIQRGESPQDFEDDEANPQIFEQFRDITWSEVLAFLDQSRSEFTSRVKALPEAALQDERHSWFPGRPLWRAIAGTALIHPSVHLTEYYRQNGQAAAGTRTLAWTTESAASFHPSTELKAVAVYNQACDSALHNQPSQALDYLAQAIELFPDFAEYAPYDSDLESLRNEQAYKDLIARADNPEVE